MPWISLYAFGEFNGLLGYRFTVVLYKSLVEAASQDNETTQKLSTHLRHLTLRGP